MTSPPNSARVNAPQSLESLWDRGTTCPFDEIIDVRSPSEYADDHLPDSVNLPVLSDAERVEVGTLYRREGAFVAAKIGAAYVSANIGEHLRAHFLGKGKEYKPLFYCWRGGQRSSSIAHVLASIGWRVSVLKGGYKTYRRHVRRELDSLPPQFQYRVVSGMTGAGKTRLLHALAARGAQVLDLENLAGHRGSVLGGGGKQPSQKRFDSILLAAFDRFDTGLPIWVEAESNRIGDVYLPSTLSAMMRSSGGIEIRMPVDARVRLLLAEYSDLTSCTPALKDKLRRLAPRHGSRQIETWCLSVDAGGWSELTASLLAIHYDPAYAISTRRDFPHLTRSVTISDASAESIDALAASLHPAQSPFE